MPTYIETHGDDDVVDEHGIYEITFPSGTVRWTDCDMTVSALGQSWEPMLISHSGIASRAGEIAGSASIRVGNADLVVSALTLAGSVIGCPVTIHLVRLPIDRSNLVALHTKTIFIGQILEPNDATPGDEAWVTYGLAPISNLDKIIPALGVGLVGDAQWKDDRCQGTGAATYCPGTLVACLMTDKVSPPAAGGNAINFCGIPFAMLEAS